MAFTAGDWTISYAAKTVTNNDAATGTNLPAAFGDNTYVGPILEFFQWLATQFAAAGQMDDDYPIESQTPTVYKWLNGWTFGHANDYKYLEGGSIVDPVGSGSANADSLWSNIYSIGSQTTGTQIYLIQADAEVTPWWITGNVDILVKVKNNGSWIQSVDTGGTPTNGGVWLYAREFGDLYDHGFANLSAGGRNPLGVNTAADSGNKSGELFLSVASATGFVAGKFVKGGTSGAVGKTQKIVANDIYLNAVRGGPFVISETLTEYTDRECQTASGQSTTNDGTTPFTNVVAGYTDIKTVFVQRKFEGGTVISGPFTFGETLTQAVTGATFKFVAVVADVLYVEDLVPTGVDGDNILSGATASYDPTSQSAQATVVLNLNNGAGAQPYGVLMDMATRTTAQNYEWSKYITRYGSTGATYKLNADDGQEYRSVVEGTYTEVKVAPFGTLAGTTMYGARGVWLQNYATALFVLIDSNGVEQSPPNYQKVTVTHASLSGCNILVAEISAGVIVKNQYTISSVTTTTIVVTTTIDINKTPQSGQIRVADTQFSYTGFNAATFTGVTPDPTGQSGALYVPLLDVLADAASEVSDNVIYDEAISVRTVVRKYGFKPYTADTQFAGAGLSFSPILTTDPQAT